VDEPCAHRIVEDVASDRCDVVLAAKRAIVEALLPERAACAECPCPALCEVLELADERGHVTCARWAQEQMDVIGHHAEGEQAHEVERRALLKHINGTSCHARVCEHLHAIAGGCGD
jgi:hypothetical protein